MIYLVHGDDLVKSRSLILNQQKKADVEKRIELYLSDTTPQEIVERSCSNDLFGTAPFMVVDTTGTNKGVQDGLAGVLEKVPAAATLIIMADKEMSSVNPILQKVTKLNGKIILNNKIVDGDIFKFIDLLFLKDRNQTYKEYEKLIKKESDPFYIFSMIIYGLRNNAVLLFASPSAEKMNPFVKMKTSRQLKYFTEESIKKMYSGLYDLEKQAKTGEVEPDLFITLAIEKVLNS
jgi:DNA polymerase III delta subunit